MKFMHCVTLIIFFTLLQSLTAAEVKEKIEKAPVIEKSTYTLTVEDSKESIEVPEKILEKSKLLNDLREMVEPQQKIISLKKSSLYGFSLQELYDILQNLEKENKQGISNIIADAAERNLGANAVLLALYFGIKDLEKVALEWLKANTTPYSQIKELPLEIQLQIPFSKLSANNDEIKQIMNYAASRTISVKKIKYVHVEKVMSELPWYDSKEKQLVETYGNEEKRRKIKEEIDKRLQGDQDSLRVARALTARISKEEPLGEISFDLNYSPCKSKINGKNINISCSDRSFRKFEMTLEAESPIVEYYIAGADVVAFTQDGTMMLWFIDEKNVVSFKWKNPEFLKFSYKKPNFGSWRPNVRFVNLGSGVTHTSVVITNPISNELLALEFENFKKFRNAFKSLDNAAQFTVLLMMIQELKTSGLYNIKRNIVKQIFDSLPTAVKESLQDYVYRKVTEKKENEESPHLK